MREAFRYIKSQTQQRNHLVCIHTLALPHPTRPAPTTWDGLEASQHPLQYWKFRESLKPLLAGPAKRARRNTVASWAGKEDMKGLGQPQMSGQLPGVRSA